MQNSQPKKTVDAPNHIAVFDLDGTITSCDTYIHFLLSCLKSRPSRFLKSLHLPLAVFVHKAGFRKNFWLKAVFLKAVAAGLREPELGILISNFLSTIMKHHLRPSAIAQINQHRKDGHRLILATASFDFYVLQLASKLGFDTTICTYAARDKNQALTGAIQGENCYGPAKVRALLAAIPDRENSLITAYTDHHSDIELLSEADFPVAVCPTKRLRHYAEQQAISIREW